MSEIEESANKEQKSALESENQMVTQANPHDEGEKVESELQKNLIDLSTITGSDQISKHSDDKDAKVDKVVYHGEANNGRYYGALSLPGSDAIIGTGSRIHSKGYDEVLVVLAAERGITPRFIASDEQYCKYYLIPGSDFLEFATPDSIESSSHDQLKEAWNQYLKSELRITLEESDTTVAPAPDEASVKSTPSLPKPIHKKSTKKKVIKRDVDVVTQYPARRLTRSQVAKKSTLKPVNLNQKPKKSPPKSTIKRRESYSSDESTDESILKMQKRTSVKKKENLLRADRVAQAVTKPPVIEQSPHQEKVTERSLGGDTTFNTAVAQQTIQQSNSLLTPTVNLSTAPSGQMASLIQSTSPIPSIPTNRDLNNLELFYYMKEFYSRQQYQMEINNLLSFLYYRNNK